MTLIASVGVSRTLDGREAGAQAMRQALEGTGRTPPALAWIFASHIYAIQDVLAGAYEVIGNVPVLGFSTSGEITPAGRTRRSVTVALLSAEDVACRGGWFPDFAADTQTCVQTMLASLRPDMTNGESLLLAAEGLNGDYALLCNRLDAQAVPVLGCLAGGELWRGRTYQIGGSQAGSGGLAGVVVGGNMRVVGGAAHGWQPVGALARLTRVQGQWVRTLNGEPASELYASLFGHPAREWSHAPLNDLVRLYPLGMQEQDELYVQSPLRIEVDGSLRMSTVLPEGQTVNIMIGSSENCRQAAVAATQQAVAALGPMKPHLAVLLVDTAWQALLELEPEAEVAAVRSVLGPDVPIAGGYTFGQIARTKPGAPLRLLNQHILVLLFGDKEAAPEAQE